ncbi:MAG: DUF1697 domain-containing protein [Mycobacteriales bacterium]
MTRWVLLLRAVNLGPRNKLAMADLRAVLTDLGHGDVRTFLNSGNATFTSNRHCAAQLAAQIEGALAAGLGLTVRACVRTADQVAAAVAAVPPDLDGYVVVTMLFAEPAAAALQAVLDRDWAPDAVRGNEQCLYLCFPPKTMHSSTLQNSLLEKLLGVSCTGRTPDTLRKILAAS